MKYQVLNLVFKILPLSRFYPFKRFLLRLFGVKIGKLSRVMFIQVQGVSLKIGNDTFIGDGTVFKGGIESSVTIGNSCDISSNVNFITGTHEIGTVERAAGKGYSKDIVVEDGVWIGFGATILGGVLLGKGCIVAAGSVVTESIPSGVLVAGVPAKIKKKIF